jgi:hypothetical protein
MTNPDSPESAMTSEIQKNNLDTFELIVELPSGNSKTVIVGEHTVHKAMYRFLKAILSAVLDLEGFYPPPDTVSISKIKITLEKKSSSSPPAG